MDEKIAAVEENENTEKEVVSNRKLIKILQREFMIML